MSTDPNLSIYDKAAVLTEALPWIKESTGKTIVIKYGGSAMSNPELRAAVASDIVLLKLVGINVVVVHGGGPAITELSEQLGVKTEFVDGNRVTTPQVMDIVKMVLVGKVNPELVAEINRHGNLAVGLSGADSKTILSAPVSEELGLVGQIMSINDEQIVSLIERDFIPVIATVGSDEAGVSYNVNADVAAGEIAAQLQADKIIFLTDVDGLYFDFADKSTLIGQLTLAEAEVLTQDDSLSSGMIPKINSAVEALKSGVAAAHILNGTIAHAMLLEVFTDTGVGTMIRPD